MTRTSTAAFVLLASLYAGPSYGDFHRLVAQGAGTIGCDQFNALPPRHAFDEREAIFSWAQGFMSAMNIDRMSSKKPDADLGALPLTHQEHFLLDFCRAHPKGYYAQGVYALFDLLLAKTAPLPKGVK